MPDVSGSLQGGALRNRGVMKDQTGDVLGALVDYTAVSELPGADPEDRAAVINNRGVIRMEMRNYAGARDDFSAVLAMKDVPNDMREMAADNLKLVRYK